MSFGFSVGDCILLLQLARTQYKNCKSAGTEYTDIAREVKSLYSILKCLRDELSKTDSPLLRIDDKGRAKEDLEEAVDGCQHILEDIQTLLVKYEGLQSSDVETISPVRKLWHRMRFASKVQMLGEVRGKIIMYTTSIAVVLDAAQLKANGRLEDSSRRIEATAVGIDETTMRLEGKVDEGFSNIVNSFQAMKNAIVEEVLKERAKPRGRSSVSLLTLSTYNDDNKEVWREFRRELIGKGFKSTQLDRHKDILKAYMLKLEQCGVLNQLPQTGTEEKQWWTKHIFLETVETLPELPFILEEEPGNQNFEQIVPEVASMRNLVYQEQSLQQLEDKFMSLKVAQVTAEMALRDEKAAHEKKESKLLARMKSLSSEAQMTMRAMNMNTSEDFEDEDEILSIHASTIQHPPPLDLRPKVTTSIPSGQPISSPPVSPPRLKRHKSSIPSRPVPTSKDPLIFSEESETGDDLHISQSEAPPRHHSPWLEPEIMEKTLGIIRESSPTIRASTQTPAQRTATNSSYTSLILEYMEDGGIRVTKTPPPKRATYVDIESVAEPSIM